jgi:formate hydrogenlyase subunit 6/NADH:ubiquinone oxidoreductase subunit I
MSVLSEMIKNLFSKPTTTCYPFEKVPIPEGFRGRLVLEDAKCIGCSRCAAVCAAKCIEMVPDQTPIEVKGKTITRKKKPVIKVFKCIRCGLCEEYCTSKAIYFTSELGDSGGNPEALVV